MVLTAIDATCQGGLMTVSAVVTGTPVSDLQIKLDNGSWSAVTSNPVIFNNSLTEGTHTVYLRRISNNDCVVTVVSEPVHIIDCGTHNTYYTLTQGYFGGTGKNCFVSTPKNVNPVIAFLNQLLTGGMNVGSTISANKTLVINSDAATTLNGIMPGGGNSIALLADGTITSTASTSYSAFNLKKGKIDNILLSQTITLGLNLRIPVSVGVGNSQLAGFSLSGGGWYVNNVRQYSTLYYTTGKTPATTCSSSGCNLSSIQTSGAVIDWLTDYGRIDAKVTDLRDLANQILGGDVLSASANGATVPTASEVTMAIDAINKGFDQGRIFQAYSSTNVIDCTNLLRTIGQPITSVVNADAEVSINPKQQIIDNAFKFAATAYPNPFTNTVKFTIESNVTGHGVLEVYNTMGQKIQTVFDGTVFVGKAQYIQYNVPVQQRTNLMYRFTVNGKTVIGKLINVK